MLFDYLDEITGATGFLNSRAKSNGTIDMQIENYNDQIERLEDRLEQKEQRLRKQFTQMEQMVSVYQTQASSLSSLGLF